MPTRYILLLLIAIQLPIAAAGSGDSLLYKSRMLRGDFSGSYATEKSWLNGQQNYFLLKAFGEARLRKNYSSGRKQDHYFYTQVGYTRYSDSVWIKSNDQFKLQLRWSEKHNSHSTFSYLVQLQSQWLDTWDTKNEAATWRGGFMNPAMLVLGYSFTWFFLENSSLLLAPATLQVNVQPRQVEKSREPEGALLESGNMRMYSRYGFSGNLFIDESFYNKVLVWQHQSRIFFNALSAQEVQFEVSNSLCFRFLKHLQLRIDTSLFYIPEQSLRIQYKQEVLLGIFYERRK